MQQSSIHYTLLCIHSSQQIFGTVVAHVRTIEFQKRGLPHAHMLFILTGQQHCWQEVDRYICAELPDPAVHRQSSLTVCYTGLALSTT